ncbi:hypothetical protein [Caulobacter sp. UC70_42]|uniref:Y-family DNA polymerase n=1 Tax=Caulobacter sp. UC70_42 TaxID=3374551 RepID=UPI003756D048
MNLAAAKAGLRIGQAVAHATALVPCLVLHDLDAEGDLAALQRLALWAQRLYSPSVAADPPDGLVIDATGCSHLFGGEEKMAIDIRDRLAKVGLVAKVAIADSWAAPMPWPAITRDRSSSCRKARWAESSIPCLSRRCACRPTSCRRWPSRVSTPSVNSRPRQKVRWPIALASSPSDGLIRRSAERASRSSRCLRPRPCEPPRSSPSRSGRPRPWRAFWAN